MEPLALLGEDLVPFLLFLLRHRLKSSGAAAFHYVETEGSSNEVEVLHDLPASINTLDDDAREGLPVEAWAVEQDAEPGEKSLHDRGDLKRIVRRCEDHPIGFHDLLDEHVPVIFQGAELLALLEALLAPPTRLDSVVAQSYDLALDTTECLQPIKALENGAVQVVPRGD